MTKVDNSELMQREDSELVLWSMVAVGADALRSSMSVSLSRESIRKYTRFLFSKH